MSVPRWADEEQRERLAIAVVAGLGIATLLVHVAHYVSHELPALGVVFGVFIPTALSVSLIGSAAWLHWAELGEYAVRVATWCVVGGVVLVSVASAITVFQASVGGPVTEFWYVLTLQATAGCLLGFLLGVYDTQRLVTRAELRRERETAGELGRRLTILNRVLRHDIRNSVNVIRGNAKLIQDGSNDPVRVAATIREQAAEMARLSEQARELEAVFSADEIETEPIDLSTVVSAKAFTLQRNHAYAAVDRSIEEDAWVEASPMIETAIENLLENAVDHNEAAEPSVGVGVSTVVRDGREFVAVEVADDGPGIPAEQIDVLERGRETALEHTSGLGLWLVSWIVSASGGEVSFEDRVPRGSVVEVRLPRIDPPAERGGEPTGDEP